jgi:hypothetical protein
MTGHTLGVTPFSPNSRSRALFIFRPCLWARLPDKNKCRIELIYNRYLLDSILPMRALARVAERDAQSSQSFAALARIPSYFAHG